MTLRVGCGTAATQKPFCRGRLFLCELDAAQLHAETPSQKKIVRLRIGCPHCGPRAGRCETPPTGCFASGENEKKPAGKCTFLTGFFLHFHCARGLSFRFPQATCGKKFGKEVFRIAGRVQGRWPCRGGTGGEEPPAPPFPKPHAETRRIIRFLSSQNGSRGNAPGTGAAQAPAPFSWVRGCA